MGSLIERYADYLPEGGSSPTSDHDVQAPVPDPSDRGSVFVNYVSVERDQWTAVWQRGDEYREFGSAPKWAAVEWALSQEASHYWIILPGNGWVPLTER